MNKEVDHTLYYGAIVSRSLTSMTDLNSVNAFANSINNADLGIFGSALWILPYYYFPLNDSYRGEDAMSYQVFPEQTRPRPASRLEWEP